MTDPVPFDVEGPVLGEVLVVVMTDDGIAVSGPCGPAPWHVEVPAGEDPMPTVRAVVGRVLGPPRLLHSTSWRRDKGGVMLTFLAVVDPAQVSSYEAAPVVRAELARGAATEAPANIAPAEVLEHALRHLAWLAQDDPVVAGTLDDRWRAVLAGYVPEPFRVIG